MTSKTSSPYQVVDSKESKVDKDDPLLFGPNDHSRYTCQWVVGDNSNDRALLRKELYWQELKPTNPPFGAGGVFNKNNVRHHAKGMRYYYEGSCFHVAMYHVSSLPVFVHMAVIRPKAYKETVTDVTIRENFLYDGNNQERYAYDYPTDTTVDGSGWDQRLNYDDINTMKWEVKWRKRVLIGSDSRDRNLSRSYIADEYVPINTTMEFENNTQFPVVRPYYFVWWLTGAIDQNFTGNLVVMSVYAKHYITDYY